MAVTYKKLWHILVDRNMKKKDLEATAGITHYQMYKLANDKDLFFERSTNLTGNNIGWWFRERKTFSKVDGAVAG